MHAQEPYLLGEKSFAYMQDTALPEKLIDSDTDEFKAKMLLIRRQLENEVGHALLSSGTSASRETPLGEGAEGGLAKSRDADPMGRSPLDNG